MFARFLCLCAALTTLVACMGEEEEKETAPTTVRVQQLGREDVAEVLRYVADLEPYAEVKIFSPVPDRILYFPWKDGQKIRRGQQVALIRKEGLDRGIDRMVAEMEALDIQIANLESELKRSRELLNRKVISAQMFDKVETQYKATIARRKALEAGKGQLAATAQNAVITAPISGIVAQKMLEQGDMAVPQVPLCRIVAIDKLKAKLKLVEADVAKVKIDQLVKIHLDAFPNVIFEGRVTTILPYLDTGTRTNTVEVTIDNPTTGEDSQYLLKPGMFGLAELVVEMREQVLAAPEPALLLDNQILEQQKKDEVLRKAFVVDEKNIAHQRLVRLGARKGTLYEVLDGLEEGDRIVIRGQHSLKDGDTVEIVTAGK